MDFFFFLVKDFRGDSEMQKMPELLSLYCTRIGHDTVCSGGSDVVKRGK